MADVREQILGKHIWYRCKYCDINEGIAEALAGRDKVRVICVGAKGITQERRIVDNADIFLTKEDLMGANYGRWTAQLEAYEKSITTVEDLVRFCFDHPVGKSEDVDYTARLAARHRAKALLGIEVDEAAAVEEAKIQAILDEEGED